MAQYASSTIDPRENGETNPLLIHHNVAAEEEVVLQDSEDAVQHFSSVELREKLERSLLRKLDTRLSILVLIYVLNYIDRNNVAAARLRGFEEDLHLTGSQFATVLSILYVGYIILQIPSNMTLNYIGKPSLYLPGCMALWGIISCLTGTATSYFGALCTRFFLGFVEAAFFPGALFLISKWYKRTELSQRTAYLSSGSLIASATGSLIASGILGVMDNALGVATWRWLFFIEGGLTVFVALCAAFILPDFPETSSGWLTAAERSLAIQRIQEESPSGTSSHHHNQLRTQLDGLRLAVSDPKVWWLAATMGSLTLSLSWNAYFPSIMATIGYNPTITLLLCAPPWFVATAIAITVSRHSDKSGERCWHITFSMGFGLIGFLLASSTMNAIIRYISLFFMAQSYTGHVCVLAWASGSISQTPAKRAVALALINTVSSLGNVFGSYIWPTKWGPDYSHSFAICTFANALSIFMCWMFRKHLASLNSAAAKKEALNDEAEGYRYIL
ncbi:major facilitator superfamily domain-containing protein [Lentinula aff. detonsa]|uniref:Major facilitator superfamily domain-containing protein n=1 Tax=Lentinula aff. detonsa TaxID=2804958 RepID=A0AA38NNB2_9AGAR|nr:major facilitator superfamily domain-containing protein [Lentinula aff. detonsa]KAJ3801591.1 major facilitator superfamily domain-containing protein [Lentinula aff. detonsa]